MAYDYEFAMPKVGITKTRYTLAGVAYEKHSVRCHVEGCWFVGGRFPTEAEAQRYLDDHKAGKFAPSCPAPPRRETLPSGHTLVERLWAELDDAVEMLLSNPSPDPIYREFETKEQLRAYAEGIAVALVMLDNTYFPDVPSVSKWAVRRRKMRLGEIPWEATPTTHKLDAKLWEVDGTTPVGTIAPRSTATRRPPASIPSRVPGPKTVSPDIVQAVRNGVASGVFTPEQLAHTFDLTIEQVTTILRDA